MEQSLIQPLWDSITILEAYLISFWAVILAAGGTFKIGEWILKRLIKGFRRPA